MIDSLVHFWTVYFITRKRLKKWKPVKRNIGGNPESSQKANNPSQLLLTVLYRTTISSTDKMPKFFVKSVTQDQAISVKLNGSGRDHQTL